MERLAGAGLVRADREGIALLVVVLLTMVVAAIAAGAALIGANSFLINQYDQRLSLLESVADGGLELGRARLNANPGLFPADSGYVVLESDAPVYDASGAVITGVSRSLYAGPLGGGAGEYGSFGAVVAVSRDGDGARTVRRLDLVQSSFAAYSYFTDLEPSTISFGSGDQLYGPVHSNSNIKIRSTGATFHGPVTTAGVFEGAEYATFVGDTASGVRPILMPTSGQFTRLRTRATPGYMAFTPSAGGTAGQSTMRIEFIARDVDGDAALEGFIRVYESSKPEWVTANIWPGYATYDQAFRETRNCGHYEDNGRFNVTATDTAGHTASQVLNDPEPGRPRCFLGGDDRLWNGTFTPADSWGQYTAFPGSIHPSLTGQPDSAYLFPLDRDLNPGFRGVIHVDGKVVVSGTVRGRVTLSATGNIIIGDDIVYATDPGAGTCQDVLGLFSGTQIVIADNTINAPRIAPGTSTYRTYDATRDEFIHATLLALDQITVENPGSGSTTAEPCGTTTWGRGCLNVTGGLIQATRGQVATSSGHGYVKRYGYDTCTLQSPPPYFPTTGHFWRTRYYEVDPTGFDVAAYFRALN
ncbi:MAG TPA: hypothetical protein VMM12_05540 [Longimicrobiales bacterium]|nr:hypothetical protein [Longimicrobiales bacterium]